MDYFLNKPDLTPSVLQMMQEVGRRNVDTILFDIDSKSRRGQDEDSLVQVFMGVFNEKLGLCFDAPVATLERELIDAGRYDAFRQSYEHSTGKKWEDDRSKILFVKAKIVNALIDCGAYSAEDARQVVDGISKDNRVNVDEFTKIVSNYCRSRGPDYTLVFMADEVGQFISGNVQRMLKLQTIVENLGVRCNGQVFVAVTSQEDVDAIVQGVSSNDFSKIQGRFTTRIKTVSSDVKEVIEKRILLKKKDASIELGAFYDSERADIQNRLCMKNQAEIRLYNNRSEFVNTYPFIPYQYSMLQDMLTSLRDTSSSGKNLSNAARSMLRIFKDTVEANSDKDLHFITPLYAFYDAIHPELDSPTNLVFRNARECTNLDDFDIDVLRTLFLVKYYDRLEKNLDNITALMIDSFIQNRIDLKSKVKISLDKLEKENFVQSNADSYMFLSNEEQEISREIKNEAVDLGSLYKDISEEAYGIFRASSVNRPFNKFVEDENAEHTNHELSVRIMITDKTTEQMLPLKSENGILFKIQNGKDIENAFLEYLRTENYLRKKRGIQMSSNVRNILNGKAGEIKDMKSYAQSQLDTALKNSRVFINGAESAIPDNVSSEKRFKEAFEILVASVYSKYGYVRNRKNKTAVEQFLGGKSVESYDAMTEDMPYAFADLSDYLEECKKMNKLITVRDVFDRFRKKPYGFESEDIQWMLAVMFRYGRIDLMFGGNTLKGMDCDTKDAKVCLMTPRNYDSVRIILRKAISQDRLYKAGEILNTLFAKTVTVRENDLVKGYNEYAKVKLDDIQSNLDIYRDHPEYPGKDVLLDAKEYMEKLSKLGSPELFDYIDDNESSLRGLNEKLQDTYDFLSSDSPRRKLFDRGTETLNKCGKIKSYLSRDAVDCLEQIENILNSGKDLPKLNGLCKSVDEAVDSATEQCRESKKEELQKIIVDNENRFIGDSGLYKEFRSECDSVSSAIDRVETIEDLQLSIGSLPRKIDNLLSRIAPKAEEHKISEIHAENSSAAAKSVPQPRKVTVRMLMSGDRRVESDDDIAGILDELRAKMKDKLGNGPFDIVW